MIDVLFICLGNICRSPMAEAVMQQLVVQAEREEQIRVDSVGIGAWHVGQPPHPGTLAILRSRNLPYAGRARQITRDDVETAGYLIAMDRENLADVRRMLSPAGHPDLYLLLDFHPDAGLRDVPDPYFTGDFEGVYRLVDAGCRGLLAHLRAAHAL